MGDDEYFSLNPKLGHIEIKSPGKKKASGKSHVTEDTGDKEPAPQIGEKDEKDRDGDLELAEKKSDEPTPPPLETKPSRLNNMINKLVGDNLDNVAAKPEIKKFKADSVETKKLRVKVPANAKPGGLLKV